MKKWLPSLLALITGLFLFIPTSVSAAPSRAASVPTNQVSQLTKTSQANALTVNNVSSEVAPTVTSAEIEGKIERGGSQIYGIFQTVITYASYIGFAVGTLQIIFGFGKAGRISGVWMMFFSSVAFFFIGYGPETVSWLGEWFKSL